MKMSLANTYTVEECINWEKKNNCTIPSILKEHLTNISKEIIGRLFDIEYFNRRLQTKSTIQFDNGVYNYTGEDDGDNGLWVMYENPFYDNFLYNGMVYLGTINDREYYILVNHVNETL